MMASDFVFRLDRHRRFLSGPSLALARIGAAVIHLREFLCQPVDPKRAPLFQPFQFLATRFGEAPQRIDCLCGDHWTEVSKCHIWLRV
jgi:hypothetical protein